MKLFSLLHKSSLLRMSYLKSLTYSTKLIDRMLNIDTVTLPIKAIDHDTRFGDSQRIDAYSYLKLWKYLNLLKPSGEDVVFDIGCGMGRILCVCACRPVRKCIGIEISSELAERARENAHQLKSRKAPIEIIVADAAEADYSEGTIYCLFNPFGTKTLEVVLERIHQSIRRCPRRIRVAYFNAAFENVMESCGWLRCYKREDSTLLKRWGGMSLWTNVKS
jgi:precorrin-6B methylase 2